MRISAKKGLLACLAVVIFGGLIWAVWRAEHPFTLYQREPIPVLELTDLAGRSLRTDQWPGPYIINVFASWCAPCEAEIPELRYYAKQLPVYGVAWQDSVEKLKPWLEKHQPPFQAVAVDNGTELMRKLRLGGVPVTIVVGADGRMAHVHEGVLKEEYRKMMLRAIMDVR